MPPRCMDAFMVWDFYEGGNLKFFCSLDPPESLEASPFLYIRFLPERFFLNDLQRTSLSRSRMIWLLPHPRYPVRKLDRRHIGTLTKRDNLLTIEGGEEPKFYDGEKVWYLYIIQYSQA
jgi:hypothetical protein